MESPDRSAVFSAPAPVRTPVADGATPAVQAPAAAPRLFETLARPAPAVVMLFVLSVLLFIVNLGGYPLYTKGEPREAVTVFDMLHGGGVILPLRAGIEIPSKPLMMHWLAALVSLAAGHLGPWTLRTPSAALALLGVILCYFYVRRLFDSRAALIAALVMATTAQYIQAGIVARVDMTLTFFMEVAFFEFILIAEGLSRRHTILYLALAFAVLSKGPIGIALPVLAAIVWIIIERRFSLLRDLHLGRGAIIVAVLAGGWYVAATIVGGTAFLDKQVLAENFTRLVGAHHFHLGHAHPFYYEELALLAGFMPWTLVLPVAIFQWWRRPPKLNPRLVYLLIWFLTVLIFYNLPASKRGVYLLALYPALAAIVGILLAGAMAAQVRARALVTVTLRAFGAVALAAAAIAILAVAALAIWPGLPRAIFDSIGITVAGFVPALAAAASRFRWESIAIPVALAATGFWMIRARVAEFPLIGGLCVGTTLVTLAATLVVLPALAATLSLEGFARAAMKEVAYAPVSYYMDMDYDVAFYSGRTIPIIRTLAPPGPTFLLCWEKLYERLPPAERAGFVAVLTSNPTDLAGRGRMLLLKRIGPSAPPASPASAPKGSAST